MTELNTHHRMSCLVPIGTQNHRLNSSCDEGEIVSERFGGRRGIFPELQRAVTVLRGILAIVIVAYTFTNRFRTGRTHRRVAFRADGSRAAE
jgi:hypothetical protein